MKSPLLQSLFDETERRPLSVSELTEQVRNLLENRFASVWVEGEISNFKAHASGHWYFTIRDQSAQLHAMCFRQTNRAIRFRPSDGLQVRARGRLTVYEPRGEYELCVEALDPVGAGAMRVAFEQMRDRLAAEGLFDEALKRRLPLLPRRIGVVTSQSGAVAHDVLQVIARRTRTVHVMFAFAPVQGEGAGAEIARAIELLNEHHQAAINDGRLGEAIDAIIVARGGGSAEDLWAFNTEEVARAIRASVVPVISGIGHETDFTIADFAADVRAATASVAAELIAAREDEMLARVEDLTVELVRAMRFRTLHERARVQELAMSPGFDLCQARLRAAKEATAAAKHKLELAAGRPVSRARFQLDKLMRRLSPLRLSARMAGARTRFEVAVGARDAAMRARIDTAQAKLALAMTALDALSPLSVLKRGYALAQQDTGDILRSANETRAGERVRVRLGDGTLRCRVEEVDLS